MKRLALGVLIVETIWHLGNASKRLKRLLGIAALSIAFVGICNTAYAEGPECSRGRVGLKVMNFIEGSELSTNDCYAGGYRVGDEVKAPHLAAGTTIVSIDNEPPGFVDVKLSHPWTGETVIDQAVTWNPKGCFATPEREPCGYPGPNTAGANCSSLTKVSGPAYEPLRLKEGETVENKNIEGWIVVEGKNVTMKNDCAWSVELVNENASKFLIEKATVGGENTTKEGSVSESLKNNHTPQAAEATAKNVKLRFCIECIHGQWIVKDSYAIANGDAPGSEAGTDHTETWFTYGNNVAEHDTLLNPGKQTAIFEGSGNSVKLTNSLVAGGGYSFYTRAGGESFEVLNTRIARKVCTKAIISDVQKRGGFECSGEPSELINYFDAGEGTGAYYPKSGFFGLVTEGGGGKPFAKWTGNFWDDNLAVAE